MKIFRIGIGIFIFCALFVAGALFFLSFPSSSVQRKLIDKCPSEKRFPVEKIPAVITKNMYGFSVAYTQYNFLFALPNEKFRFEENTLQEYEEPIYLPTYLYSMFLTFGRTRTENYLAPYEIRFIVYPSWCNSEKDWTLFLKQYGWEAIHDSDDVPMFTMVEKIQSGRTYRRLFVHDASRHYEFETSWDNAYMPLGASESAQQILESFVLTRKEEKQ